MVLVLLETSAGFGLFKLLKDGLLSATSEEIHSNFSTSESCLKTVNLHAFSKFNDLNDALEAANAISESQVPESLRKFLKKKIVKQKLPDQLIVTDPKLGGAIKESLKIPCVFDSTVMELVRGLRSQIDVLFESVGKDNMKAMSLGLSHSLSRFRLKFSPDKVDTMIIQAIALLDDIDKELNIYIMRLREWYGWHFPELGKIVPDNSTYINVVSALGHRSTIADADLSFLEQPLVESILTTAAVSMGVEVSEGDMLRIIALCTQVKEMTIYRSQLYDYLRQRMAAVAPNLTTMVGELVGARLIAHAGSLMTLAKHPSSTVQVIGAEKALFRALRSKQDTPKYGLIFHASLVGQASSRDKGRVSRSLAAKASLSARVDALSDHTEATIAIKAYDKMLDRMAGLEGTERSQDRKKMNKPSGVKVVEEGAVPGYNVASDVLLDETPKISKSEKKEKKKKEKKDRKKKLIMEVDEPMEAEVPVEEVKQVIKTETEEEVVPEIVEKKDKKKKKVKGGEGSQEGEEEEEEGRRRRSAKEEEP
ncbi:hypothetical protein GEMRC1_011175 [Eukaryota sp. GEM-RC1]